MTAAKRAPCQLKQLKVVSGVSVRLLTHQAPHRRLKLLRIERGIEQEDLAAATGLSLSLVRKIEQGNRAPSKRASARLENVLGQRMFSKPAEYRQRNGNAARPKRDSSSSRPAFTFTAGSQIELDDPQTAERFASDFEGRASAKGNIVTFHTDITVVSKPNNR